MEYTSDKGKVKAIQFNGSNAIEVMDFSKAELNNNVLSLTIADVNVTIGPGDFILEAEDGTFSVLTPAEFVLNYHPVEADPNPPGVPVEPAEGDQQESTPPAASSEGTQQGSISAGPAATGTVSPGIDSSEVINNTPVPNTGLSFGAALNFVKSGGLAAREGWNGKGMFIFQRPEDTLETGFIINNVKSLPQSLKDYYQKIDSQEMPAEQGLTWVTFTAYLCMKAADGSIVNGWLASQTDMLAEDWQLL